MSTLTATRGRSALVRDPISVLPFWRNTVDESGSLCNPTALVAARSATHPRPSGAAKPKRARMNMGATVSGEGFGEGRRGRGIPGGAAPPRRAPEANAAPQNSREQGFQTLGRWGIKNFVATARI